MFRIIDTLSKEVLEQIPAEYVLRMAQDLLKKKQGARKKQIRNDARTFRRRTDEIAEITWMYNSPQNAYLESRILSASPIELVCMLLRAAIDRSREAAAAMEMKDVPTRTAAIGKTLEILGELQASLNHDAGGELSRNLDELYAYMQSRLLDATLQQSAVPIREVEKLLSTVLEGWNEINVSGSPAASATYASAGMGPVFSGETHSISSQSWSF